MRQKKNEDNTRETKVWKVKSRSARRQRNYRGSWTLTEPEEDLKMAAGPHVEEKKKTTFLK